jgi:hypothetical protein
VSGLLYQLRDDFPKQLSLCRANFSTALNYGVRTSPTVLLFHHGRLVKRWANHVQGEELWGLIEDLLDLEIKE